MRNCVGEAKTPARPPRGVAPHAGGGRGRAGGGAVPPCPCPPPSPRGAALPQPLFSPSQDPVAGSRVFGAKGCGKCHSINGVGGKIGPAPGRTPRPRAVFAPPTPLG